MTLDLSTRYLGLALASPLIASPSPLTLDLDNLRRLEDCGAGAVVLPSIFQEQISQEAADIELQSHDPRRDPSLPQLHPDHWIDYRTSSAYYLRFIEAAKSALEIPVIASISAVRPEGWEGFLHQIEAAGAAAVELNLFAIPSEAEAAGSSVEARFAKVARRFKAEARIPVAVKLVPYLTSAGRFIRDLEDTQVDGFVLFNRFYQPDIDLEMLRFRAGVELSHRAEARLGLFWISLLSRRLNASLAASSGVETHEDVVKYLLAGADVVMTASALLRHGVAYMRNLVEGTRVWLQTRAMTLGDARGRLSRRTDPEISIEDRMNYVRVLRSWTG